MKNQKGKLIVIDGVDGSGKSTQTALLLKKLKKMGRSTFYMHFPQHGKRSAAVVDDYLNGKYGKINAYQASIMYAIDRFDASFKIRSALSAGKIVVLDRYTTSNAGHQGAKMTSGRERQQFFEWLKHLEFDLVNLPVPDKTFILHVPANTAHKLIDKKGSKDRGYLKGRKRDVLEADRNHLRLAEQSYLEIAALFPKTKLISCMIGEKLLAPEEIHAKIWKEVIKVI